MDAHRYTGHHVSPLVFADATRLDSIRPLPALRQRINRCDARARSAPGPRPEHLPVAVALLTMPHHSSEASACTFVRFCVWLRCGLLGSLEKVCSRRRLRPLPYSHFSTYRARDPTALSLSTVSIRFSR